jgi:hypothetical protein
MRVTLSEIQSIIEQHIGIDSEVRNRMLYRFQYNAQLIEDWKKHLLRTVHQDAARHYVLQLLDDSNVVKKQNIHFIRPSLLLLMTITE